MKIRPTLQGLLPIALCLSCMHGLAQPGAGVGGMMRPGPGPSTSGAMKKVFGKHTAFTADVEMQIVMGEDKIIMPGKMAVSDSNSRFEMDVAEMKGGPMPPQAIEGVKQMGMDKTITITRGDKELMYMIYPGLKAYAVQSFKDPEAARPESDFEAEVTELGKETVGGRPCVKNRVVVTDKQARKHTFTVWNATDLENFPVQIETADAGATLTWIFKDVKLGKPDAALFDPPADYKKYDSLMALMQDQMMKRMQQEGGTPR